MIVSRAGIRNGEPLKGLWRVRGPMIVLPLEVQATPTCSTPGEKIPALIGPLAAILQRCVALNDSQAIIPALFQTLLQFLLVLQCHTSPLTVPVHRSACLNREAYELCIMQASALTGTRSPAAASMSPASRQSGRALHQLMQPCLVRTAEPQDRLTASDAAAFRGRRAPSIPIHAYLHRFAKYAKCSPVCFVMAQTYLERLSQVHLLCAFHHCSASLGLFPHLRCFHAVFTGRAV